MDTYEHHFDSDLSTKVISLKRLVVEVTDENNSVSRFAD